LVFSEIGYLGFKSLLLVLWVCFLGCLVISVTL